MNIGFTWVYPIIDNDLLLFLSLFILGILNSFFPPVPLESLAALCGYLTGTGHGNLVIIWLASATGMSFGNILLYLLARSQGEHLLRWGFIKAQLTPRHLHKAEGWFHRYGTWAILGAKIIPGMNFTVVFCCGVLRSPCRKIYPAFFFSNLLLFGTLVGIARYVGEEWHAVLSQGEKMAFGAGIILIVFIVLVITIYRRSRKTLNDDNSGV